MIGLRRTTRFGIVIVAGALLGLAGCLTAPSKTKAPQPLGFGSDRKGDGGTITPAQEADVQISMGRVAEQQGDLDQAMAAYRAALERDRRRADAYARLAIVHDKQGKFRESAELYRKALAVQPGNPEIFCDMGYSFYLQRRWAEADMNLRQAIAINPEHQRSHNNLALLLVRDNRLDEALAEFGKGGSNSLQSHMNVAFALTLDQRWESARAEYQRALQIDPTSQVAKTRLAELNALVAKLDPSRGGAPPGRQLLTTSTSAAPPVAGPASQPVSARSVTRIDPALVATAATVDAPRRPPLVATAATIDRPRRPAPVAPASRPPTALSDGRAERYWDDASTSQAIPRRLSGSSTETASQGFRPIPPPTRFPNKASGTQSTGGPRAGSLPPPEGTP
jgi:Tfp pilus assembly protein PilF